jgi:hypothetical protein
MDIARRGRIWLVGIACAGIALSHEFGYQVENPGVAQKVHVLEETGHAYLPLFMTLALIALTLGIVGFLAHRIVARTSTVPPNEVFLYTATRLLGLQAAGFLLLEVGERVLSGNGFTLADSPVALALMMHVVLALLGAGLLRLLARVVDVVLDAVENKAPEDLTEEPATTWAATSVLAPVPLLLSGGPGLRGPPSSRL